MKKTGICRECPLYNRPCMEPPPGRPDILFIGEFPLNMDIRHGAFTSPTSSLLRRIVARVRREHPQYAKLSFGYTYACLCEPEYDVVEKRFRLTEKLFERCRTNLLAYLDRLRPKAICTLGEYAAKALGIQTGPAVRGIHTFKTKDGVKIHVNVVCPVRDAVKYPGLVPTLETEIRRTFRLADGDIIDIDLHTETKIETEKILPALERALTEIRATAQKKGRPVALACAVETVFSHGKGRVIAIGLSWQECHGLAFPFEHRLYPYASPDDWHSICNTLEKLLNDDSVYLIMADGKTGIQWLRMRYGIKIDVRYDITLAEHQINEDKQEYGLEMLISDRFPSLAKEKERFRAHLEARWTEKAEKYRNLLAAHHEKSRTAIVTWWCGLTEKKKVEHLAHWIDKGVLRLSELRPMHRIRLVNRKGKTAIPAKYQDAADRLVRLSFSSEQTEFVRPPLEIPEEMETKNNEDAEIAELLRYTAMSALSIRMICHSQLQDFNDDSRRIAAVEKCMGRKLATLPLGWAYRHIDLPLSHIIAEMEYNGIRIDRDRLVQYIAIIEKRIVEAKDSLFTQIGYRFDPSPAAPDLRRILYEEMHLPVIKRTDTGIPCTDSATLAQLAEIHELPLLGHILALRKLEHCLTSCLKNWLAYSGPDGKIHCEFNQTGTVTYRLSCSKPNLQQIPSHLPEAGLNLKALFLPDSEDFDFYNLDIRNAELRVLAAYSRDKTLIDAFHSDMDLHCLTAAGFSGYSYEEIMAGKDEVSTPHHILRRIAKKINFGIVNCMSAQTLREILQSELRIHTTEEQAQEYLNCFFRTYPGVRRYINHTRAFVERYNFCCTFTGRRRRFPLAFYSRAVTSRVFRQAVNAILQATSADLTNMSVVALAPWLKQHGGRILLTAHDSIAFQLPKGLAGVSSALDNLITGGTAHRAPWLPVTWVYDVGKGRSYGETCNGVE